MQKLIDTVSAQFASGIATQKKTFGISSGPYAGRVIIVYPQTSGTLVFRWADFPYTNWSAAQTIASNSADYPATAFMDSSFNVYVAYTVQTTLALNFVKLTFANGVWSVGSTVAIVNVEQNYYPSLFKDQNNKLWCAWSFFNTGDSRYYIRVKTSVNDGATWGTGPSDTGTALTSGNTVSAYCSLAYLPTHLFCLFTQGGTTLEYRRIEISGSSWDSAITLYSGTNLDYNFSAAVSSDLRLGLAFRADANLFYKEYNGNQWSGLFTVDSALPQSVNLQFLKNAAYIFFAKSLGTNQNQLFQSSKSGSSFSTPAALNVGSKAFEKVFCFDQSATTQFADKTTEAQNATSADLFHPTSGGLIKDSGDALYLGMEAKFNLASFVLSSTGITGQVAWQYWNGSTWTGFTPYSGVNHLTSSPQTVILWQDLDSVPVDWQGTSVNGAVKFWVRALVTTNYTTAPVGTQITATAKIDHITG